MLRARASIRGAIRGLVQEGFTASSEPPRLTWRRAAECLGFAGGELRLVRRTMDNMARAGELERVGTERVPGVRRPMTVYAPAAQSADAQRGAAALDAALRGWAALPSRR